jgi:hypothetical protein
MEIIRTGPSSSSNTDAGTELPMGRLRILTGSATVTDIAAPLVLPWFGYVLVGSLPLMATMYLAEALIPLLSGVWLSPRIATMSAGRLLSWSQQLCALTLFAMLGAPLISGTVILYVFLTIGSGALGFSSALTEAALGSLISGEGEELTTRAGQLQQIKTVMQVAGLPLAGILIGTVGASVTLVLLVLDASLVSIATWRWAPGQGEMSLQTAGKRRFLEGFSKLWQGVEIRSLAVQAMLGNFGATLVASGFLYYLLTILKLNSLSVSVVYLVIGLGSVAGAAVPGRLLGRFRRGTVYPILLMGGFSGLLLLQLNTPWAAAAGEGIVGLCDTAWVVLSTGVRLELLSEGERPLVLTSSRLLSNALIPLGGMVVAAWGLGLGFSILFGIAAVVKASEAAVAKFTPIGQLDAGYCCAVGAMKNRGIVP